MSGHSTNLLTKTYEDNSPVSQLQPLWKGPYPVLLSSLTAVKVLTISSWIYHSRVKPYPETLQQTLLTPVNQQKTEVPLQKKKKAG